MNTNNAEEESKKRGRGIPKGSKNKQRDEPATKKRKTEKSLRQRAEQAAYGDLEEEESCQICQFKFSDPIKKDKQVTRCPDCKVLVHEPCLAKSGCISDDCFLIT